MFSNCRCGYRWLGTTGIQSDRESVHDSGCVYESLLCHTVYNDADCSLPTIVQMSSAYARLWNLINGRINTYIFRHFRHICTIMLSIKIFITFHSFRDVCLFSKCFRVFFFVFCLIFLFLLFIAFLLLFIMNLQLF